MRHLAGVNLPSRNSATLKSAALLACALAFLPSCRGRPVAAGRDGRGAGSDLTTPTRAQGETWERVEIQHGAAWSVEYRDGCKIVTVREPWRDSPRPFTYVLVPRGQAAVHVPGARVVDIPVRRFVALATNDLPFLDRFDVLAGLVGFSEFDYVNNPTVRQKIESGAVREVGVGQTLNLELVLELDPEVVFGYALGDSPSDLHNRLSGTRVHPVLNASYMEQSPLGRFEWIKFLALFFNAEGLANSLTQEVASEYARFRQLAATVQERPTVFSSAVFNGVWYMSGGASYTAHLYQDAGGDYLWKEDTSRGAIPLDFEGVFARAAEADFWLDSSHWQSLAQGLAEDERYALFKSFRQGDVFNHNARLNGMGGDDFFEQGTANPHLVLKDLIRIFHPHLLPDHELYWYHRLQ